MKTKQQAKQQVNRIIDKLAYHKNSNLLRGTPTTAKLFGKRAMRAIFFVHDTYNQR